MMTIFPLLSIIIFLFLYSLSGFIGSVNFLNSSRQIVIISLYVLLYLFNIHFFIKKRVIFISIAILCFISGGLFILYSIAPSLLSFLKPNNFQFIIPTDQRHNHLGDLMGVGLISLLASPLSLIYQVIIGVIYLLFMVISFSKSAFLATIATLFFIVLARKGKYILIFICVAGIAVISLMTYSQELSSFRPISLIQNQMERTFHLKTKLLLSGRDIYFAQIAQSWVMTSLEHSFFGYGPGNFIYASNKSAYYPGETTSDAHNLLLTIIMESGMLAVLWFLLFFALIIFIGKKTNNSLVFLVMYLFINFQTDYTYRIPLFFALFFTLCGQIVAGLIKKKGENVLTSYLLMFVAAFTIFSGIYSYTLHSKYYSFSRRLDTINIRQDLLLFEKTALELERITPYDEQLLLKLSSIYEVNDNVKESIRLLDKLSFYSPRIYLHRLPHQLDLQKKMNVDVKKYIQAKKRDFTQFPFTKKEKKELNAICEDYAKMKCIK